MNLYKLFKTDESLETAGIFIEYGENSKKNPIRFKVARAGGANKAFAKALEKATKPYRKALEAGMMDDAQANKIYKTVFVQTVLLGWENLEDENGKELPFSVDNAMKLFTDLPDLFTDIREQASNSTLFRESLLEDDLGNSGESSATDLSKDQSNKK